METTFTYDRPVTGKANIGRKADCEQMRAALMSGRNVVIYEPPKQGKSSLIRQTFYDMRMSGEQFAVVEVSLLGVRSIEELSSAIRSAIIGALCTTPSEQQEAMARACSFEETVRLPYQLSVEHDKRIFIVLEEFQNILFCEQAEKHIHTFEEVVRKASAVQRESCTWIWCGSQVNAMKSIFEEARYFYRLYERVHLSEISYRDIENFLVKGFLTGGKVIEKEQVQQIFTILRGNIWYISHFASICDGLSRGYIPLAIFNESVDALLAIHEGRFVTTMNDLTTFQVTLLRAILDGQSQLSSAEAIEKYSLNSSANVRRLKDALCKKEIITMEGKSKARIMDPLFEYWLRREYFKMI